jgi:hypothetical protein
MNMNRLVGPILLSIVLMLVPSYVNVGQGQTSTSPTATNQCLDFDGDGTCEYIILANGTQVANPLQAGQSTGTSKTAQGTNFQSYNNPTLGIKIQYPVGWQLEEDNDKTRFVQQKDIVSLETDVDNNIDSTLSEYVDARTTELREQRQDFKLIESTPTTISGNNPAHKLIYTFLKEDGPRAGEFYKVLRLWTIKDHKLYSIAYLSEPDKFSEHLPAVEKAIDSFRISPVIQKTSTTGSSDSNNDNRNNERNNDNNQRNWRDDPNCWYYEYFVCYENGKCDNDNFDCVTDCDDGSSVTTGFPCPGESDEGVPDEGDGDDEKDDVNPYCDKLTEEEENTPGQGCWDRLDSSDSTGLYPCNDGSNVGDWRYCRDVSGFDYEEEDTSNEETEGNSDDEGNEEVEEEDQNCGGEPCTDDEKEDSTTDEDDGSDGNEEGGDEYEDEGDEGNIFGG